jgi:hypothetical protein
MSASEAEDAASKILKAMDELYSEYVDAELPGGKSPSNMMMKMGYGSAMHDLRHVIGDLFPELKD